MGGTKKSREREIMKAKDREKKERKRRGERECLSIDGFGYQKFVGRITRQP